METERIVPRYRQRVQRGKTHSAAREALRRHEWLRHPPMILTTPYMSTADLYHANLIVRRRPQKPAPASEGFRPRRRRCGCKSKEQPSKLYHLAQLLLCMPKQALL